MEKYVVLEKEVGETPHAALETWRAAHNLAPQIPLAYAGRLDPMASGKLLVLIGDECKKQSTYHGLDKEYLFEILLGVTSDTGDVLGLADRSGSMTIDTPAISSVLKELVGTITLPYPAFSSKTVHGKPLFLWKLEGRIDEIDIPTNTSRIHRLTLCDTRTITTEDLEAYIRTKIDTIPEVTEPSKNLGADFRRAEIRARWSELFGATREDRFTILRLRCICSGGTYMRTLAPLIAQKLGSTGLALSIHRTQIGTYNKLPFGLGFWRKSY